MKLTTAQPARHPQPTTKALALAYLMFDRPDLERAERFLNDFGLVTVRRDEATLLLRGTGAAPFCYVVRKAPKSRLPASGCRLPDAQRWMPWRNCPGHRRWSHRRGRAVASACGLLIRPGSA